MPRNLRNGLAQVLKNGSAESHTWLILTLPSDIAPSENLYLATAPITIDGVKFDGQLRTGSAVKTSITRAADRASVEVQNVDTVFGVDSLRLADSLYGAKVQLGRYWRDLQSGATFSHGMLTGIVASVEINENVVKLGLISDVYSTINVGASEQVVRKCRWQIEGRFRGTECGYSGALLTCNGLYDSADGCEGRHGSPLKQAKYGGFAYIESASTIAGAAALPIPASNQLLKTVNLTTGAEVASVKQQPFLALDDDRFHTTNNNTNLWTEIAPKGMMAGLENAVDDYNAPFDGVTDATTEVQAAITAAEASGGTTYLAPGIYKVTGLTISGRAKLAGSSDGSTVIYSTTNGKIIDCSASSFEMPVLENLRIRGDVLAGSSQIGVYVDDGTGTGGLRTCIRNLWIENCGGAGFQVERAFSSIFDHIYVTNCAGFPFLYNAPNMPSNLFVSCYAGLLRDSAPVGFRIKAGDAVLKSCNGVNSLNPNSKWSVVGKKNGVDGDSTDSGANLDIQDCNLESWIDTGILLYHASQLNVRGLTSFVGQALSNQLNGAINNSVTTITVDSTANFSDAGTVEIDSERITYTGKTSTTLTGCTRGAEGTSAASHLDNATVKFLKKPIVFDLANDGVDYFAHALTRGIIEDSVRFADAPLTNYVRNQAIHANGLAPIQTVGRGARIVGGSVLQEYWNATAGVDAKISRSDSNLSITTVTATTTISQPGVSYIEVDHSAATAITLPWPALYQVGSYLTVKDVSSGGASANNITLQAGGGGTVNGSSFVMDTDGQAVILVPDGANDWRIVATYTTSGATLTGSGSSPRLAYWSGASSLTSDSDLTYDGFNLSSGRVYHSGGSGGAPGVGPAADTGTGMYQATSGTYSVAVSAGATGERVRFQANGINLLNGRVTWDASETIFDLFGSGSPEGSITASIGSVYRRSNGGTATTLYIKESGTGNTGWVAVGGSSGANTALSNLASVAINTTLVSDTNNTDDLGSSSIAWKDLYLAGTFALKARTDPGSPTNDDVWRSSTRQAISIRNSGQTEDLTGVMWRSSNSVFFDTTTTETSIISDTGVGTKTLAASRLVAGTQVRIKASGFYGTKASSPGTFTVKLKNGATTMLTIAAFTLPTNVADQNWWIEATGALNATGSSGTIYWTINFYYNDGTGALKTQTYTVNSSTINTTTTEALDITGKFSVSDVANFWQTGTASIEIF